MNGAITILDKIKFSKISLNNGNLRLIFPKYEILTSSQKLEYDFLQRMTFVWNFCKQSNRPVLS